MAPTHQGGLLGTLLWTTCATIQLLRDHGGGIFLNEVAKGGKEGSERMANFRSGIIIIWLRTFRSEISPIAIFFEKEGGGAKEKRKLRGGG